MIFCEQRKVSPFGWDFTEFHQNLPQHDVLGFARPLLRYLTRLGSADRRLGQRSKSLRVPVLSACSAYLRGAQPIIRLKAVLKAASDS